MRSSKYLFFDACYDIKCHLQVGSYEMHDYDDGCYADFKVQRLDDPNGLNGIVAPLEYRIFAEDGMIIVRVFENYHE